MKKLVSIHPDGKLLTTKHAALLIGVVQALKDSEIGIEMKVLSDKSIGFYTKDWYV